MGMRQPPLLLDGRRGVKNVWDFWFEGMENWMQKMCGVRRMTRNNIIVGGQKTSIGAYNK